MECSLVFMVDGVGKRVLLGRKLRGNAKGRFNGFGGKFEPGEQAVDCAIRECREESGIVPVEMDGRGRVEYRFFDAQSGENMQILVWVFVCSKWEGKPNTSDEMEPHWFEMGKLPWKEMQKTDKLWVGQLLTGNKKVNGWFLYDRQDRLESWSVEWEA